MDRSVVTCSQCGRPIDESLDEDGRAPCPVCGATARTFHESLTVVMKLTASIEGEVIRSADVPADASPYAAEIRGEYSATLRWTHLSHGRWLIQVLNDVGDLVDGGIGDNPEDALLEVYERLIPPA